MERGTEKRKKWNIQKYLIFCAMCFVLPIIIFMAVSNLFAAQLMMEKIAASTGNTSVLYAQYLDEKMVTLDHYLLNLGMNDVSFSEFASAQNEAEAWLAGNKLKSQVSSDESLYETISEGIFFYSKSSKIFMRYTNTAETLEQQKAIEERIKAVVGKIEEGERSITAEWFSEKIGEKYYVFRIYNYKGIYYGSWCNVDKILENLVRIQIEDSEKILLLDSDGNPLSSWEELETISDLKKESSGYSVNGKKHSYMIVSEPIWKEAYYLTIFIKDQDIHNSIQSLIQNLAVLLALSVLILIVFLNSTKKRIGKPLENLSRKMGQVEKGDLTVTLPAQEQIREFSEMNTSFNSMVQEIKNLRIQVYEEIVQRQKTELEFLKIQIKPHFFINALNLIFNYARMDEIAAVKAITMNLVRHFRYTLYGKNLVPIREEIAFIQNYLQINEWKNKDSCSVKFIPDIPEEMQEIQIPILAIQTFVENSIKFGENEQNQTNIMVKAEKRENQMICLLIQDSGRGFGEQTLMLLNRGERIADQPGRHVGIENVRNRMKILYGEDALLRFYNREEGGAAVEITIPAEVKEKNELTDR